MTDALLSRLALRVDDLIGQLQAATFDDPDMQTAEWERRFAKERQGIAQDFAWLEHILIDAVLAAARRDPEPVASAALPAGAILASALMAANYGGDSGEDVDRLIHELYERGYELRPMGEDGSEWLPGLLAFLAEIERDCSPLAEDAENSIEYNEGICDERGRIAGILDSLLSPEAAIRGTEARPEPVASADAAWEARVRIKNLVDRAREPHEALEHAVIHDGNDVTYQRPVWGEWFEDCDTCQAERAVEAAIRGTEAGLDVERLAQALRPVTRYLAIAGGDKGYERWLAETADAVIREYVRLASADSEPS